MIGCGALAESAHIPNLLSLPNVEIGGICDNNPERLDETGRRFSIERRFLSHKELLDVLDVDAVVICTTADAHAEICIDSLNAGKDVFVEKPLALNLDDARRVLRTVEATGRVLQVGYQMRFLPNHAKTKELMRTEIGKVYAARIVADTLVIKVHETLLIDYMTHLFDLARWYFDDRQVARVGGMLYEENDVQVGASATISFEGGRLASVEAFWVPKWSWGSVQRRVEILGEGGKLITDVSGPTITLYKEASTLSKMRNPRRFMSKVSMNQFVPITDIAYRSELTDFFNCVAYRRKPVCDVRDGYMALLIAEAAKESHIRGKTVEINAP